MEDAQHLILSFFSTGCPPFSCINRGVRPSTKVLQLKLRQRSYQSAQMDCYELFEMLQISLVNLLVTMRDTEFTNQKSVSLSVKYNFCYKNIFLSRQIFVLTLRRIFSFIPTAFISPAFILTLRTKFSFPPTAFISPAELPRLFHSAIIHFMVVCVCGKYSTFDEKDSKLKD